MITDKDLFAEAVRQIRADLTGPPCPLCLAERGEHRVLCPGGKVPCVFCKQTHGEHLSSCLGLVLAEKDLPPPEALVDAVEEDTRQSEQEQSIAGQLGRLSSIFRRRADELFAELPRANRRKDQIRIHAQAGTWLAAESLLVSVVRQQKDRQRRR